MDAGKACWKDGGVGQGRNHYVKFQIKVELEKLGVLQVLHLGPAHQIVLARPAESPPLTASFVMN